MERVLSNPVTEAILKRRSIRAFREEQIPEEELLLLLECALYAPTGGNLQNSRFLVIQMPALMEELNTRIKEELAAKDPAGAEMMARGILRARTPGYHFIYHAPTLISAVSPREHSNSMANCCMALENIQIAAYSLGLGSCFSNQPHWLTRRTRIRELFEPLGLRDEEDIFGSVAVGYPAAEPKAAARRPGRVRRDIYVL